MAYTLSGPAGNAASWGGIDPTKAAQVAANATARGANPNNTWGNWGQNFAGNVGGTYDPTQTTAAAPYNPMSGAAPGVSLGQVASGASPTATPATSPAATGGYPAINPGESSMAYMQRIGMSPADAQAAYQMSQQNPGMSFQDIIAKGGYNIPGYGGSQTAGGGAAPTSNLVNQLSQPGGFTGKVAPDLGFYDPTTGQGGPRNPDGSPMTGGQGLGWNSTTGYGPGTGPGSSSTSFGVPPAIAQYLDPSMAFQEAQGEKALQSSAAAQGNLLSGPTLKALANYSQGLASTGYNNAFNQAAQQQGFGAGLSQQDWLNNLMLAQTQAGQGQYGTTGTANTNNLLATLLSQNALAAGNAGAAGTIGGANAISGGVSQAIANMLAQNLYNRIPALNPTGP